MDGEVGANLSLREILRTPFYRREARAVGRRARIALYVAAVLLNLAALASFSLAWEIAAWEPAYGSSYPAFLTKTDPWVLGLALGPLGLMVMIALFGSMLAVAPAIAEERENNTLDALLMTPLSRRVIAWAKLLGRTEAVRRFLLAAIPVFVLAPITLSLRGILRDPQWLYEFDFRIFAAIPAGLILWALVFLDALAVAAIALHTTATSRRAWTAALKVSFAILWTWALLWAFAILVHLMYARSAFQSCVKRFDTAFRDEA